MSHQFQEPIIEQYTREYYEKMAAHNNSCNNLSGLSKVERDVSPIQAEVRAVNDALDRLHLLISNLADRLAPALIQRGVEPKANGTCAPAPIKSPLGRDVESIGERVSDATEKLDFMLSCLHL